MISECSCGDGVFYDFCTIGIVGSFAKDAINVLIPPPTELYKTGKHPSAKSPSIVKVTVSPNFISSVTS